MLKVFSIPILSDNYVHVLANLKTRECVLIDPGQSAPVQNFLLKENLHPQVILLTHHHWDHIGGAQELKKIFNLKVYAPLKERKFIEFADEYLQEGDLVRAAGFKLQVLDLSGHTLGHLGYWEERQKWLFSGDVLFGLGCGRVFDGTLEDHYQSLGKIKSLPMDTWVYCTHEYTELNLKFCLKKFPEDPALLEFARKIQQRHEQQATVLSTVPFTLKQELDLNPFLKTSSFEEFAALREERNQF